MLHNFDSQLTKLQSPRLWVIVLLFLHAEMLVWSSIVNSPTVDEPRHISAGLTHWRTWNFHRNPGNPPLPNMIAALPLLFLDASPGQSGEEFMVINGTNSFWYVIFCRWAGIPFSLLGGYICFRWARVLHGDTAGLLALILWCFCPDILANGQLATCDMAATSMGVTACFAYWQWLRSRTWEWAIGAGVLLGILQLTKYVWVMAYPLWFAIWCLNTCIDFRNPTRPAVSRDLFQIAAMMVLSLYVINTVYVFDGTFSSFGSHSICTRLLKRIETDQSSTLTVARNALAQCIQSIPTPLPRQYVYGVDSVVAYNQDLSFNRYGVYLQGERKLGGWWYFYLTGMAVKLPIGFWVLMGLACLTPSTRLRRGASVLNELFLIGSAVAIIVFVSVVTTAQFSRYVLPAYPFLFIWVGKVATIRSSRPLSNIALVATISFVTSSVGVFPHSLSYFNELAGGPRQGHQYLVNSAFDWGQDLFYLRDWLRSHAGTRAVRVAYSGLVDPKLAGIGGTFTFEPSPGLNAISVTVLRSGYEQWSPCFLKLKPIATAGYTIYIYDIDVETVLAIRKEAESSK